MGSAASVNRPTLPLIAIGIGIVLALAWPLSRLSEALTARSVAGLTPAPFATIDSPAPGAGIDAVAVLQGRVAHETIRAPIWLVSSRAGAAWRAEAPIATGTGTWEHKVYLWGRKGTQARLALIAAEIPLHNELKRQLERQRDERPPCEPSPLEPVETFGPRGRWIEECYRRASLGDGRYPPLPEGARLVTSVDVVTTGRDADWELDGPAAKGFGLVRRPLR